MVLGRRIIIIIISTTTTTATPPLHITPPQHQISPPDITTDQSPAHPPCTDGPWGGRVWGVLIIHGTLSGTYLGDEILNPMLAVGD